MDTYYLAIDIGASSGRHILGHKSQGKMIYEEVYRFPNGMKNQNGHLCWDLQQLFLEIKTGMKVCKQLGKIPVSVGIDTWGVDFVLLDFQDQIMGDTIAYRDGRTKGMDLKVYENIPEEELYERTGIQKQLFNSIYQLMAIKSQEPEKLVQAKHLLMIPDYFHFLLSGVKVTEYTNATTTQLVNATSKMWDKDMIQRLGYPEDIFCKIVFPGTELGYLTEDILREIGFDCKVVVPATHDTGSAVVAVPSNNSDSLYISSGTWSLIGTELKKPNCSLDSMVHNLTNEGGYGQTFRYLKNIMGLWMIQSIKKEIGSNYSFGEICEMAEKEDFASIVDCNDPRFLAPSNMMLEIQEACKETNQEIPYTLAQLAATIYHSLAVCYSKAVLEIEQMTQKKYESIHIIGGGANADYLNKLTAKETKLDVIAGPMEATAVGNLTVQMIANQEFRDVEEARACITSSFTIKKFLVQSD